MAISHKLSKHGIMEVRIIVKKDNGEEIEITRSISEIQGKDIIDDVEKQVHSIKEVFLPLLSEQLVEHHKTSFRGKKNKEEER